LVARLAGWAAAVAALVVALVLALFGWRVRQVARATRHPPAPVPASVAQRSLEFTFSGVEGQQTVYTIRAARATQFSGRNQSLLEDVEIVVYGRHGERHDEIHTHSCDYLPATGGIVCHGQMNIHLENLPMSAQSTAPAGIDVETRNVTFDRDTGAASTDAPVVFRFPRGQGTALGLTYFSRQSDLQLHSNVQLSFAPDSPGSPSTIINSASLAYDRATRCLRFSGPVRINQGTQLIAAPELTVDLNNQMRPRLARAAGVGRVRMTRTAAGNDAAAESVEADAIDLRFDAHGRTNAVNAAGQVVASVIGTETGHLAANRMALDIDPVSKEARNLQAEGNVRLVSQGDGRTVQVDTALLHVSLVPTGRPGVARLEQAETPGPAHVEWDSGGERLGLRAGRLLGAFDEANQPRSLDGEAGVQVQRSLAGELPTVSSADALQVNFSSGLWTDAEELGHVRATQGTRAASAERARWVRASDAIRFSTNACVTDPTGQTLADSLDWNQQTGIVLASGHVRSSYTGSGSGATGATLNSGPTNLIAEMLDAQPASGEAVYSGGARLWQGDLVIEADRIDLQRSKGILTATGRVQAAFPQAQARGGSLLWRVRAQKLTYVNSGGSFAANAGGGQVTLEGGVQAMSSQSQIDSQSMVLDLARDPQGRVEVSQAVGRGGVTVRQLARWGQAERAIYDAAAGKFVLTGGHPELRDTAGDLVTGDRLTFYVSNDTIQVESAEGSRTLTEHPVPK
jgi:lipopolysaccharide export system protein LptA